MTDRLEVVLCVVDGELVAAPTRHLEQIVEYRLHPEPPGGAPWLGGLAVFDGSVLASLSFSAAPVPTKADTPARVAKGLLFRVDGRRFVVEVQRVADLAEARVVGASLFRTWRPQCPPGWLLDAATRDKEAVPLLNISAVCDSLYS